MPQEKQLILIVEDEPYLAQKIAKKVEKVGPFTTMIANNGKEALEIINQNRKFVGNKIKCVLCDIKMPIMDGIQFVKALRRGESIFNHVPVIMLTAYEDSEKWSTLITQSISGYLKKPVNELGLQNMLHKIVIEKRTKHFEKLAQTYGEYRINQLQDQEEEAKSVQNW